MKQQINIILTHRACYRECQAAYHANVGGGGREVDGKSEDSTEDGA